MITRLNRREFTYLYVRYVESRASILNRPQLNARYWSNIIRVASKQQSRYPDINYFERFVSLSVNHSSRIW